VTDLMPDFDEGLSLGVTPGQSGFFERIGSMSPSFTPLVRPCRQHTSVSERMELGRRRGCRHRRWCGDLERKSQVRPILAGRLFLLEQYTEPSLDTSDTRPSPISFHGPQNTHGMPPKC
jgi:hypothetical protein